MGRKPKPKTEEIEVFSRERVKMFEKQFKEDLETAEKCFVMEKDIRFYLWGKGFEFALELVEKEFINKELLRS